jgi:KaiC/GvpD/RAD55 family RecA-like ATPase
MDGYEMPGVLPQATDHVSSALVYQTHWTEITVPNPSEQGPIEWSDWVASIQTPTEWPNIDNKELAPAHAFARFNGRRNRENCIEVTALMLDYDDESSVAPVWDRAKEFDAVIHSTHSHTDEKPKFRLAVPLSRPVPAAEWPEFWNAAAARFGGKPDQAAKDCSRAWFVPCKHPDREAAAFCLFNDEPGPPLDVDRLLQWHRSSPVASAQAASLPGAVPSHGEGSSEDPFTNIRAPFACSDENIEVLKSALRTLDPVGNDAVSKTSTLTQRRNYWLDVAMALNSLDWGGSIGWQLLDRWSKGDYWNGGGPPANYDKRRNLTRWQSLSKNPGPRITIATLFALAKERGWSFQTAVEEAAFVEPVSPGAKANGRFPLIWFDDIQPKLMMPTLIKGLLSEGAYSVVYGESGSGKTFAVLDLGLHVALGLPWQDRKTNQRAVVYVAAEGASAVHNRVEAFKRHHAKLCAAARVPFAVVPAQVDLVDPDTDTALLIERIKEAARAIGMPVGLVIIDTLSRAMAGGDENSSQDMGSFVRNTDRIRAETGAHVLIVHHSGKNRAFGARGHSLLRAATDTEIEVFVDESTGFRQMLIKKQRDLPTDGRILFQLVPIHLGLDQDGDAVTSCVVERVTDNPSATEAKPKAKIPPSARRAFELLQTEIAERPSKPPVSEQVPTGVAGIQESVWRQCCEAGQITETDTPDARRKAFGRAAQALNNAGLVRKWNNFIWIP